MRSLEGILMQKQENKIAKKKVSDAELTAAYVRLKSCWKVAEVVGLCGQTVHRRLKKIKVIIPMNYLTQQEKHLIEKFYRNGFKTGDGQLEKFSKLLGRTKQFICRYAKSQGLTNLNRKVCDRQVEASTETMKKWHKNNEHPKGMLGKTHCEKFCSDMSKRTLEWHKNATLEQKADKYMKMVNVQRASGAYDRRHGSWKSDWRTIGGKKKYFRSRWEANYARYLQFLKEKGEISDWIHECQTFWFLEILRGCRSYLPDFKVINLDGSHYWVEVKGWMDDKSVTKLKRFAKYYPQEKLELIQAAWFNKNSGIMKNIIKEWEV